MELRQKLNVFISMQKNPETYMAETQHIGLRVNVLKWLSQSPDLNPILNLWQDLKIAIIDSLRPILLNSSCFANWTSISGSRCTKPCLLSNQLAGSHHICLSQRSFES